MTPDRSIGGAAAGHASSDADKPVRRLESDFDILDKTTIVDDVAPVAGAIATDAIVQESQVDVLLMLSPGWTPGTEGAHRLVRVKVWSKIKPTLFSYTDIPVPGKSQREMAKAVEYAAAALAERQCVLYGDMHEIARCALGARKHFIELCAYITKQHN